jgi:hypothetical protein
VVTRRRAVAKKLSESSEDEKTRYIGLASHAARDVTRKDEAEESGKATLPNRHAKLGRGDNRRVDAVG